MAAGGDGTALPVNPEWQHYSRYSWCLSPALSIRELRIRLHEEWQRYDEATIAWLRSETRINLYLLLSALHCTAADYLADRPFSLAALSKRAGRAQPLVNSMRALVNGPHTMGARTQHRTVERWSTLVQRCLDAICRVLLDEPRFGSEGRDVLDRTLPSVVGGDLPERALAWRMRIPEAFRCQDLTHHDVYTLAELLTQRRNLKDRPTLVVGPRTAGAYFAPLLEAYLFAQGFPTLGWLSIRPKAGLTSAEQNRISKALKAGGRIVVTDDHPNTGDTFVLILKLLRPLGAEPRDVLLLAPQHPAETDWTPRVTPAEAIRLPLAESYKSRLLRDDQRLLTIVRELSIARNWKDVQLVRSNNLDDVNRAFETMFGNTFQTRMKRLIEIRALDESGKEQVGRLLFKSVGWGWLAYHAYFAGERLKDYVPQLIGLREGLLVTEWVGPFDAALPAASDEEIKAVVPNYIAQRAKTLRVPEDPWMSPAGYRAAGWDRLLRSLRHPLGSVCARFAAPLLKKELRAYATPFPTLVDGRIGRENWIATSSHAVKSDFEHHNFGGGEQDFVDPAFDLAGATLEMNLSPTEEDRMIQAYVNDTGDEGVRARLPLYKLHVGHAAMADAVYYLDRPISDARRVSENLRYLAGRNFLTYQFNRHNSERIGKPTQVSWTGRLFFLDLDGVFDTQALRGFPHTTTQGLVALSLLRQYGYSVVPNTGRSVEHVRNYCEHYAFPGGLAEYGCVLVDRVQGREIVLVEPRTLCELERFREVLRKQEGVFLDPGYKVAVRAYRFENGSMSGPVKRDIEAILEREGLSSLDVLATEADAYILPKGQSKKTGMEAVVRQLESKLETVTAMGDSDADIDMLLAADLAYAPLNCSPGVSRLARSSDKVRLIRARNQEGLLRAVADLIEHQHGKKIGLRGMAGVRSSAHLIDRILDLASQPEPQRSLRIARSRFGKGRFPGWEASL